MMRAVLRAMLLVSLSVSASEIQTRWVASPEPGWPQFRGPARNGISSETGLRSSWPEGGPPVLWTANNLGGGYCSPIMVKDLIYITGDVGKELHVFALDLEGQTRWTATNGAAWKNPFPGARAACTYSASRIYHMNGHGRVACLNAQDGRTLWSLDTLAEFDSRVPTWGMADCLLVDSERVIVTPGGKKASMAALDKRTGEVVWTTEPLLRQATEGSARELEGPAYSSPILIEVAGNRQIVAATARHIMGVNAADGKLLWTFELPTRYEVIASAAVLCDGGVFVTAPDSDGGKFLRFVKRNGAIGIEPAWTASLDTCHGGIIALESFLYGSWYRSYNGWGCVNIRDGTVLYRDRELAMGSAMYADGHLYCLSQSGTMALVRPNPDKWEIVSRFQFAEERKNDVWAHPVVFGGRMYLRHQSKLVCYNVKK